MQIFDGDYMHLLLYSTVLEFRVFQKHDKGGLGRNHQLCQSPRSVFRQCRANFHVETAEPHAFVSGHHLAGDPSPQSATKNTPQGNLCRALRYRSSIILRPALRLREESVFLATSQHGGLTAELDSSQLEGLRSAHVLARDQTQSQQCKLRPRGWACCRPCLCCGMYISANYVHL